tara:strand:- start:818 stop:994 length:177 start_codon:yes stop_codon:yes gene_type:complete
MASDPSKDLLVGKRMSLEMTSVIIIEFDIDFVLFKNRGADDLKPPHKIPNLILFLHSA